MIGTEFSSRYSMIWAISDALISRMPDRISDTAPGRTPIAVARPPLVLPGFSSPRSINLTSSMAVPFPDGGSDSSSDYPKSSLTFCFGISEIADASGDARKAGISDGSDKLGARALGRAAGISCPGHDLFGDCESDQLEIHNRVFAQ